MEQRHAASWVPGILCLVLLSVAGVDATGAGDGLPASRTQGLLRQSADNPRYFADAQDRMVYLTGSHSREIFQDVTQVFDYPACLDRLSALHHKFHSHVGHWIDPFRRRVAHAFSDS